MGWLRRAWKWLHQYDNCILEKPLTFPTCGKPNPFLERLGKTVTMSGLTAKEASKRLSEGMFESVKPVSELLRQKEAELKAQGLDVDYYRKRIEHDQYWRLIEFIGVESASKDFDPAEIWYPDDLNDVEGMKGAE